MFYKSGVRFGSLKCLTIIKRMIFGIVPPGQPDHHVWGDCIGLGVELADHVGGPGAWDDVDCRDYPGTSCACMK